ncbi:hypothetical protein JAO76_14165 [Pontibacter sp. BT310]|uniref:Outer membrane protein beta-barrel domain-containing protein n=1 Tax=Pontibacter populi TaxID=890055 RepID=A0ABS6XEZ3_9BACT|nr:MULTISPECIES: outer membrane beta-barrel protein [Pontibacter]MBJ6119350.1 hypothetical protein [Pontibacter sp. BT310]MBR0571778.1 hypothetical protein [Microvirga sp. STS03]MBW3366204.1 hypothetical protein [Pontibacter populi]
MKKLLLSATLIVLGFTATAQDIESNPIRLRLGGGVTMATGDFKSTDVNNDKSGYAKNGIFYSLSIIKDVHSNFAIGLSFAKGTNKFDKETYRDHFIRSGVYPVIKADNYKFTHMTGDIYGQVPVNNSAFYAKASLGLGFLTSGDIEATIYKGNEKMTLSREDKRAPSLVAGLGAGFRHDFGKFGMGVEVAYTYGKLKFDESYKQLFATVNSTLGLYYRVR